MSMQQEKVTNLNSCVVLKKEEHHTLVDAVQPVVQSVVDLGW